jgi:hypothetical protein
VIPFLFPVLTSAELVVIARLISTGAETPLTIDTDYAVALNAAVEGGTVTLVASWASTYEIHVIRQTATTNELNLQDGGLYAAPDLNGRYDKLTRIVIENADSLRRAILCPQTDSDTIDLLLPNSVSRALTYLYFDANGNVTAVTNVITGSTAVSNFWKNLAVQSNIADTFTEMGIVADLQTFLLSANISSALTALGAGAFGKTMLASTTVLSALALLEAANTVGTQVLAATTAAGARATLGVNAADDIECWEGEAQTWRDSVETWMA